MEGPTAEDLEKIKQERQAQLKMIESLDFNSFVTNKEDVEEQFGNNLKKKFKYDSGEARNVDQKDKKFNSKFKKGSYSYKSSSEKNEDDQNEGENKSVKKEKKEQQPRNVKPKPPKQISSNWQSFMKQTQQKNQENEGEEGSENKPNGVKQPKKNQEKENESGSLYKSLEPQKEQFKGTTPIVAIDCEMVQCQGANNGLPTQELARVSIVNFNGHVLLDSYVRPQKKIRDYLTRVSGITFNLIKNAPTYPEIKEKIFNILKDKILVGHSVQHDLSSIKFEPAKNNLLRDISNYKELKRNGKKVSLKKMVHQELGITFQEGSHDSIADARAALLIYKKYQKEIDQEQGKK